MNIGGGYAGPMLCLSMIIGSSWVLEIYRSSCRKPLPTPPSPTKSETDNSILGLRAMSAAWLVMSYRKQGSARNIARGTVPVSVIQSIPFLHHIEHVEWTL